jgi:hypothetical protein
MLWRRSQVATVVSSFGGVDLALDRPGTIHSYAAPARTTKTTTTTIAMREVLRDMSLPPGVVHQSLATAVFSRAARRPLASLTASSSAQKCMKKRRGCSVSI